MALDDIVGGLKSYLKKKYHGLKLRIALDDALSHQFVDGGYTKNPWLQAGSLAVTPFALASALAPAAVISESLVRKAEAQTQETCNVYRANSSLTDAVQTNDYRAMFGFDSCKIYSVQISSNERLILAEHPVTKNKWSVREINGQPGNAQEILNSADMSNNVSVNLDGRAGDEQLFAHYTNPNGQTTVRSYPVSSSDRLIQDLSARNGGTIVPNQAVQAFFQESQMPLNVKSVADANGRTYAFLFAGNGNQRINPQNAQFFDFQRKYPVGSIISGIESRLRERDNRFAGVDDVSILNGNGGPTVLFLERRASEYAISVNVNNLQNGNPVQYARVMILGIDGKECTTAQDGGCVITRMPASFTGVKNVIIDARDSGYVLRGFQQNFDGRNLSLEDRIVPANFVDWDLYNANPRWFGGQLNEITGIVTGGHTVKIENLLPRARYPNNLNTTRYMIITDNSLTRTRITPEMIRLAEDVMIEVVGLISNGEVVLTRNDIEKVNTPFLNLPHPIFEQRREYVFMWQDFADSIGGSSIGTNGSYIVGSIMGMVPLDETRYNYARGVLWHEMLIGAGTINEQKGDLGRRIGPQQSIMHPFGGYLQSQPTPDYDIPVIRLHTIRPPGHRTATIYIPGIGTTDIPDFSPVNR